MIKDIVFTEGRNDLKLIEKSIQEMIGTLQIEKFIAEDIDSDNRGKESKAIRNFSEPYNQKEFLIKSEGGKPELKSMFSTMVTQLDSFDIDFHLLIDLDGGDVPDFCTDINERCRERFPDDIVIKPTDRFRSFGDISVHNCELLVDDDPKEHFNIVSFSHSMEITAGVHDSDCEYEKMSKIYDLSSSNQMTNTIEYIFIRS